MPAAGACAARHRGGRSEHLGRAARTMRETEREARAARATGASARERGESAGRGRTAGREKSTS
eukprot:6204680-Prymnesium_polylepis.1